MHKWDANAAEKNTVVFNTMAWMQIFTLINARRIAKEEYNMFTNIHKNGTFMITLVGVILT